MRPARETLRRPDDLIAAGLAPRDRLGELEQVAARYALALTPDVVDLIDPADPRDPIARQFVPDAAELDAQPQELVDPIGDDAHSPVAGIVHRYPDRVLLKPVHVCAVYCRFCFRRETVGRRPALSRAELDAALDYIRAHSEIWEVILTGGDPLVLSPRRLRDIVGRLAAIEHVKIIRVHTRVPVVEPQRVSPELVLALKAPGKATYVALHVNHARELSKAARDVLRAPGRCRHPDAEPDRAVARRQRRRGDTRRVDAGAGRVPDQALLPAPRRSRARHRALAHQRRGGAGADARVARPAVGTVSARPMCSIFRAGTGSRRSGRATSSAWAQTARRTTRSRTSTGAGTSTRRLRRRHRDAERVAIFISCSLWRYRAAPRRCGWRFRPAAARRSAAVQLRSAM